MRRMAIALVFAGLSATIHPCCGVDGARGVVFKGQSNIIVWNPETKTQHFIRNARFESKSASLGFIAPSPTEPELGEADEEAFAVLRRMEPYETETKSAEPMGSIPPASAPTIIKQQDVAGFKAVVLKATDARGLKAWLDGNGYKTTPDIEAWFDHYIKKNWYFTAFKVDTSRGKAETGLVRMSFKTEAPFNPYFVPKSNIGRQPSGLEVFFVSTAVYDTAPNSDKTRLETRWSATVNDQAARALNKSLGVEAVEAGMMITNFRDSTFPNAKATDDLTFVARPPADLNFTAGPPPSTINPLWIGVGGGAIAGLAAWMLTQRKKA